MKVRVKKWMTIAIEGVTFEKQVGEGDIYCENYGVKLPNSSEANTFDEMVEISSKWLETQD